MIKIDGYNYKNEQDIINNFRDLLKPESGLKFKDYSTMHEEQFKGIIKWMHKNNYTIKEFPNAIQQELSLNALGSDRIRNYILSKKSESRTVRWSDRRKLIDSLTIQKTDANPDFILESNLSDMIKKISLNSTDFSTKTRNEKINLLNNCTEYILKHRGKYIDIDESIFFGFFDTNSVKKYRADTQVFRHTSEQSLSERNTWTNSKKDFYIKLGIILITQLYQEQINKNHLGYI